MKRTIFPILSGVSLYIHEHPIKQNFPEKSIINNIIPTIPLNAMEFLKRVMPLSE